MSIITLLIGLAVCLAIICFLVYGMYDGCNPLMAIIFLGFPLGIGGFTVTKYHTDHYTEISANDYVWISNNDNVATHDVIIESMRDGKVTPAELDLIEARDRKLTRALRWAADKERIDTAKEKLIDN